MNRDAVSRALAKVASGIYITSCVHDGARIGMLASFIEQAAFEPPMISMAVARDRPLLAALDDGGMFAVNILGEHNRELLRVFLKAEGDPFAGHALVGNAHGLPIFAEALGWLVCRVRGKMEAGDHWLYLAEVLDGALQHDHEKPMVRIRHNGFGY